MLYIKISNIRVMKIIEYIIGAGKIGLDSTVPFEMIWLCFYFFQFYDNFIFNREANRTNLNFLKQYGLEITANHYQCDWTNINK